MTADAPWADLVRPIVDRFRLGGKLGCDVRLDATSALATGAALTALALLLDAAQAENAAAARLIAAQRALVRDLWLMVAWLAALAVLGWLVA
jgi:hypothetical protein